MKRLADFKVIKDNRIVKRFWVRRGDGRRVILSQGKRVPKDFPLSLEERRAYVKGGSIGCAALMRKSTRTHLSLREIVDLIKSATGTGGL
ncbi:hypothetical protein EHM76_04445 [bacterium]|nr:MAG: hypothetical protein EHM76_04445 [bacterium]